MLRYSGPTAGFSFGSVDWHSVQRVFVLGPSHHVYIDGGAITCATHLATPVGNLVVDAAVVSELMRTVRDWIAVGRMQLLS